MRDLSPNVLMTILTVNGLCMILYDYIEAGELYGRVRTRLFTFVIWEYRGRGVSSLYLYCLVCYTIHFLCASNKLKNMKIYNQSS